MLTQRCLARRLVRRGNRLLVSLQADLGIDNDLPLAGQANQHIGLQTLAIGPLETDLGFVFAALVQAGMLEYPLQHQLAPVALLFLSLQGTTETRRLVTQALVELLQALQLMTQRKTLARLLLVALLDPLLEGLDAFLEWLQQLSEALLTVLGETLLALLEDLPCQLGKLCTQAVTRALQVIQALLLMLLLLAQLGSQRAALGVQAA